MSSLKKRPDSSQGMTIIEVMVASAILAAVVMSVYQYTSDTKNNFAHMKIRMEVSNLRQSIRDMVNCGNTLARKINDDGSVNCSGSLALLDSNSRPLPSSISGWSLRATCDSTKITVKVQKMVGAGIAKDPLTKWDLSYTHPDINPLFGGGSAYGLCENQFHSQKKIRTYRTTLAAIGRSSSECARVNPSTPLNINAAVGSIEDVDIRDRIAVWGQFQGSCFQYCLSNLYSAGGFMVSCDSSGVTCVCSRS